MNYTMVDESLEESKFASALKHGWITCKMLKSRHLITIFCSD